MNHPIVKLAIPHLVALVVFFLVSCIYFFPQIQGKVLEQTDIVSFEASTKEIQDYKEKNGRQLLWTNAIYSGMPTFQTSYFPQGNLVKSGEYIIKLFMKRPIGYFIGLMVGFYILMVMMGVNPWISIIAAIAYAFTTNNFVLYETGHSNKLRSLIFLPVLTGGLIYVLQQKKYLLGGSLFALGLALNLYANHVQMTYYFFLCLLILAIIYLVQFIRNKEWTHLGISAAIGIAGVVLAVGSAVSNIWPSYEYGEQTMRGKPILEKTSGQGESFSSSETDGLSFAYAMQWSNGFSDALALFAPRFAGGSSTERIKEGPLYDAYQSMLPKGSDGSIRAPVYWGNLGYTSGPYYFGAVVLFLFVLGLILVKGPLRWWVGLSFLLTYLLSLGDTLGDFQRLFFDYFPFFNKFRAPSSILTITSLFLPFIGFMAVSNIIYNKYQKDELLKAVYIAGGITGGFSLLLVLMGSSFFDFLSPQEVQNYQSNPSVLQMLADERIRYMRADAFRTFAFIAGAVGLLWAYANHRINTLILIAGLGLLTVADLWAVGRRYIATVDFESKSRVEENNFQPRPVDQQILSQENSRGDYRVFDMRNFTGAFPTYFHNTVGGYSAVKLQRIQDLIDYHFNRGGQLNPNPQVLNMLNAKYTIDAQQQLITNPGALGNAWFVEDIQKVNTPNEEIQALSNFNAAQTAIVLDSEFNNYIGAFDPQKNGSIDLTEYDPQHMVYQSNSTSEQLAVFSEVWYGPDLGWQAYIDGQPVDHIRANYLLRALRIPDGEHKIEFVFSPRSVKLGTTISMITSLLILLSFLGVIGLKIKNLIQSPPEPKPLLPELPKPLTKPAVRRKKAAVTKKTTGKAGKTKSSGSTDRKSDTRKKKK